MHWYRLAGASAAVRRAAPSSLGPLYHAVTLLGSPAGLMVLLAVAFWVSRRRDTRYVFGLAFLALGTVIALKTWFALPRPPASDALVAPPDPYGFPSGHAVAATIVYGGAVLTVERLRTRAYGVAAGVVVAAVSLSRVALGVHYLGDVVAGVLLGLLVLAVVPRLPRAGGATPFALAVVAAVAAFALVGASPDVLLDAGGSLAGLCAVAFASDPPAPRSNAERAVLVVVGPVLLVAIHALAGALSAAPLVLLADTALVGAVFFLPHAVGAVPLHVVRASPE